MRITEILAENIFTTDYHKVMNAVAKLYQEHYNVNIWDKGDAHDEAAKVLLKVHPTDEELDFILSSGALPERFMELDFPINDDVMFGSAGGDNDVIENDLDESVMDEEPASRALCQSGKPNSALGASNLASCKAQGYRARDTGKSQKIGSERVQLRGTTKKSEKYGGPVSPTRTG